MKRYALVIVDAVVQVPIRDERLDLPPHVVSASTDAPLNRLDVHAVAWDVVAKARDVLHDLALQAPQVAVHVAAGAAVVIRDRVVGICATRCRCGVVCDGTPRLVMSAS
mgnify:FL=1